MKLYKGTYEIIFVNDLDEGWSPNFNFSICVECGSMVRDTDQETHNKFHDDLEDRFQRIEN